MPSQPEMLAFASVCLLASSAILLFSTIRLLHIASALLEMRRATVTTPERQPGGGQMANEV